MSVLELRQVTRVFGEGHTGAVALDEVSLCVEVGELVVVMGPSGSGKSTLLQVAGGIQAPTAGEVRIGGQALGSLKGAELALLRRRRVGFVFQTVNLLATLTAVENVSLPLELDGVKPRKALSSARSQLESLGLGHLADRFPGQLSGGECQRVAIARAVAGGRSLLLADEPTAALDSLNGEAVMQFLRQQAGTGCAIVVATHDVRHAGWADRVVLLRDGRIAAESTAPPGPESLLHPERTP
ncbi:MAG: ABC transporter ATP-binding protein [Actinomycetota bacterium]